MLTARAADAARIMFDGPTDLGEILTSGIMNSSKSFMFLKFLVLALIAGIISVKQRSANSSILNFSFSSGWVWTCLNINVDMPMLRPDVLLSLRNSKAQSIAPLTLICSMNEGLSESLLMMSIELSVLFFIA